MLHPQSGGWVLEVLLVLLFSLSNLGIQRVQLPAHLVAEKVAEELLLVPDLALDLRDQVLESLGRLGLLGQRQHLQRHESVPL